jgi:hypothetical protein
MEQGHPVWDFPVSWPLPPSVTAPMTEMEDGNLFDASIFNVMHAKYIVLVCNHDLAGDEDNDPIKDNIPTADSPEARVAICWMDNNCNVMVDRMKAVRPNKEINSFRHAWTIGNKSYLKILIFTVPGLFFQTVICKLTFDALETAIQQHCGGVSPLSWHEVPHVNFPRLYL